MEWVNSSQMDNIMKTYREQQRERIADLVGDYLGDDKLEAQEFIDDILAEVKEWRDYHQKQADKADLIYLKLNALLKPFQGVPVGAVSTIG